ncbi:hypothetical protein Chor_016003 [Crotalus horridus]
MIKEETNKKSDCCKQELKEEYLNDSESTLTYHSLLFCASRNTDRIHAYTKAGEPLNCNFIPLDIKVGNWEDLPACFQQKQNHTLILRYMTKEDIARASLTKADSSGGSVRIITKTSREVKRVQGTPVGKEDNHFIKLPSEDGSCPDTNLVSDQIVAVEEFSSSKGYLQAVDNEGNPLCLRCQKPTIQVEAKLTHTAWDTRFCSLKCQEDFFFYTNNSYLRTKVFEIEHGVCQLCGLNAQELYLCVRDAPKSQRKDLLEKSWMSKLPLKQVKYVAGIQEILNEIILNPAEGHFWQVDHIKPVFSGGGQCTLENFQTLCTVCHKERTAKQAKERSQVKKQCVASKYASDITKFFVKL